MARVCDEALDTGGTLTRLARSISDSAEGTAAAPNDVTRPRDHVANFAGHVVNPAASLADQDTVAAAWLPDDADQVVVPAHTVDGRVMFVAVSRRAVLRGVGASAVGLAAGSSLPPVVPDLHPAGRLEAIRKVLIDSDNLLGPTRVIPAAESQVHAIQQMRQAHRGADHRALLEQQTKFAEFAGWLHQDAGDHQSAQYWTDRALQWSHGTGDQTLTTFILARKSQLAGDMGDAVEVIDAAGAAESLAPDASRLAAVAATFGAHGYAMQGDHVATLRAYDKARAMLDRMDTDPSSPGGSWGVWLDAAYIDVAAYRSLAVVGDYTGAAAGFMDAIDALPEGYYRDKGVYLARAARAHAGAGDQSRAAELGIQALAIGTETGSGRILTELTQLDGTMAQGDSSAGAEFSQAMADTIGRQL